MSSVVNEKEKVPIYFSDVNLNYRINNRPLKTFNLESINYQIRNILSTEKGSRRFRPTFGSDLMGLLFEPMNEETAWRIETSVYDAIEVWMKDRIILDHSQTTVIPDKRNQLYTVYIKYVVLYNEVIGFYKISFSRKGISELQPDE